MNVALLLAVGINNEGHLGILGLDVATGEDGAAWLAFWRSLVARGLRGVQLVTSDDHPGLRDAVAATIPDLRLHDTPHGDFHIIRRETSTFRGRCWLLCRLLPPSHDSVPGRAGAPDPSPDTALSFVRADM